MSDQEINNEQDIFASLNVSKILVAILETQGEVTVPTTTLVAAANEDKDLQVDYNSDEQTFVFKLKTKAEATSDQQ